MSAYLFVHFREKTSPEGEQVYFGVSRDGFKWEEVNGGQPVLWAYYGDKGVRDHTITYCKHTGKYVILATDLSLSYGMRSVYDHSWTNIRMHGSKCLSKWESGDLVNWTEQTLVKIADEDYGCVWAPDIIYDRACDDYMVHWSSTNISDGYKEHRIYYSKTMDFEEFTPPQLLFERPDGLGVIDSAIYEENGRYYMFLKSSREPAGVMLYASDRLTGGYEPVLTPAELLKTDDLGRYEGTTAVKTDEGKWLLFVDYFGVKGAKQGYRPYVSASLEKPDFSFADAEFSFPYRFKHGTVIRISDEEYERIKACGWEEPDRR